MADPTPTPAQPSRTTETEIAQPQTRRRGIIVVVVVVLALVAAGHLVALHLQRRHRRRAGQRPPDPGELAHRRPGAQGGRGREPGGQGGRHDRRAGPQRLPGCGGERAGRSGQRAGQCRRGQRERAHHHHQHRQQSEFCRSRCERHAGRRGAGASSSWRPRTPAWPRPRPTTPRRRPIWSATSRWWKKT